MDYQEYWIGRNVDLDRLWRSYSEGLSYTNKYDPSNYFELKFHFSKYDKDDPLFNFEVIQKSLKGIYHEIKQECLTPREYVDAGPLYIQQVERGSEIWTLLVEQIPGLLYLFGFLGAIKGYVEYDQANISSIDTKLKIIDDHFPNASEQNKSRFLKAWNFYQRNRAIQKLVDEGLTKLEMSDKPQTQIDTSTKIIFFDSKKKKNKRKE